MARSRNIKPAFFTNDSLAECQPLARLLFIGLWTIADREGRLEDRPKKIKAEILPYDNTDCDYLLNELHENGFIIRYCADDISYIQVVNFVKHQNPYMKEGVSTIPAPDLHSAKTGNSGASPADSLIPLIDSPIPDSPLPPKARETAPECFDQFWELYPRQRRGSKDKALLAYKAAMKRGNTETTIIEGVKTYAASSDVAGGYAKGCAAWLNDDGFNNQYKPVGAQGSRPTGGNRGFDALATAAAKISQGVDREAERLRRENPVLYYQRLANQSGGGNDIAGSLEAPDAGKPDAAPLGIGYSQEG